MSISVTLIIRAIQTKLEQNDPSVAHMLLRSIAFEHLKPHEYKQLSTLIIKFSNIWTDYFDRPLLRLTILGGYTTQPIRIVLRVLLCAEGFYTDIYESPYNTYQTEILDGNSGLYAFNPDIVLLATGACNLLSFPTQGDNVEQVSALLKRKTEELRSLWVYIAQKTKAIIVQHNYEWVGEEPLGRLENKYPWSQSIFIQKLNEALWQYDGKGVYILDVFGLSARIGITNWHDPRWYYHSKYGYAPDFTFQYGHLFCGLFRALRGVAKKCLVTDLDNTLWGGVVGDDGLSGIALGSGTAEGEAFAAFCTYLKKLKQRGVILAVNSKNDPTIASEVFSKHASMPLRMDDFSAFYCNWEDKTANFQAISRQLNIGLDSLVFIDDNPAECAEIRQRLPSVTVVELHDDPAYFIQRINELHLFDQLDITEADVTRSSSYETQFKVNELRQTTASLEEFLSKLGMTAEVKPAVADNISRVTQLFQKTNQFNLTTQRYDHQQVKRFTVDEDKICLCGWLKDMFFNYGLVTALVAHIEDKSLLIDNWVMSCRVFGRTFEHFIFNTLLQLANERGCTHIKGTFIPTAKNAYVREMYTKFGFTCEVEGDIQRCTLSVSAAKPLITFVQPQQDDQDTFDHEQRHF